ncbi:YjbH domain-containing protein [Salinivibrio kushneri]|uniref:YjbH domain-containing protein n=1 Tax=Salinivibrio kushneri TaxID=1908198 RepID=UPI000C81A26D|nr:YjbH domain-containing protein [Salinivibrio kushneri]
MMDFSSASGRMLLSAVALAVSQAVSADSFDAPDLIHSQTDFGGVGLMQMPTARTAPEGEFTLGSTYNEDYIHFNTSLQLFPWLETTIRYTQVHDLLYSNNPDFSGDTKYTDKSIDAKLRLMQESFWLPEIAVGVRDIGGTGLFDGEYIVGSKRAGPFDFSLGVGWGYMGNRATLTGDKNQSVDCGRDTTYTNTGGSIELSRMFTGCAALFGGVEYQTPYAPLSLKFEYDGNDYKADFISTKTGIPMEVNSPWNVGAVYRFGDWGSARLAYERGAVITAGLSLHTNFNQVSPFWLDDNAPSYRPTAKQADLSNDQWQVLSEQLASVAGYQDNQVHFDGDTVTVTGEQSKYRNQDTAQTRASTLIANTGIDAKQYRIIDQAKRQPITETVIDANTYAAVATNSYVGATPDDARMRQPPQPTSGTIKANQRDNLDIGLAPVFVQSFGGSEDFYMYSLGVTGNAAARLDDHLIASSSVYVNIADTYDKFKYTVPPDGTDLKRVRTLTRQYLEDTVRVTNVQLTYLDHWGDNWYTQTYGGYLETMFAGVGGEVLYRPMDSQFAIGLDANYVKQREPGSAFGLFKNEYQPAENGNRRFRVQTGTTTGHATLYWQNPLGLFNGTLAKISAGRYLTEDVGVTVDIAKQFDSGITVGAYASKTDLSAEEFGEGSFTKGFYVSIPFDLLSIKPTTGRGRIAWQPLQRDGGQKLSRKYSLYQLTDSRNPWFERP